MKVHARKIATLFKKDFRDTSKNMNVMILLLLPPFFALLYSLVDFGGMYLDSRFVLLLTVLMNVSLVPVSFLATIIAEEKEKNTLRTLMLSNVTAGEFLLSKALLTFLYMQAVNVILYFLTRQPADGVGRFLLVTSLSCICVILIGACMGMIAKDQMSTGVISVPFSMLLLLPPMFGQMNESVARFARFIPSDAMIKLIFGGDTGGGWMETALFQVVVIALWTIAAGIVFTLIFRRKQLDN